ncbi:MAG: hypothetical protein ACXVMI_10870 [Flavisolibacter sp.]
MKGKPLYISLLLFGLYAFSLQVYAVLQITIFSTACTWGTGFLAFTLIEYLIHRWLFHIGTDTGFCSLWRSCCLHHYNDDHKNFGVSSRLWDLVFGTYQPRKEIYKSKKHTDATAMYRHS